MQVATAMPFVADATVSELSLIATKLAELEAKVVQLEAKNGALESVPHFIPGCAFCPAGITCSGFV